MACLRLLTSRKTRSLLPIRSTRSSLRAASSVLTLRELDSRCLISLSREATVSESRAMPSKLARISGAAWSVVWETSSSACTRRSVLICSVVVVRSPKTPTMS